MAARRRSLRGLSARALAGRARFEEAKHRRDPTGKFADKPGAGDDAPRGGARSESARVRAAREAGRIGDVRREQPAANPPEHDAALRAYAGNAQATYINARLRFPDEVPPLDDQDWSVVRGMDAAVAAGRLESDEVLYRGVGMGSRDRFDAMAPGQVIVDRGFVSTSRDEAWARGISELNSERTTTVMEIRAPAGTPAAQPQHNPQEQEVIFGRGTRLRFVGREGDRYVFDLVP